MGRGGFGGFGGGMGNMQQLMRQAQKMQQDILKMQQEMEGRTYTATAGGGMVTAEVTGKHELKSLTIEPDAVDPEDVERLQDRVIAAVNEAMRKAETSMGESMAKVTGGLNLGF